MWINDKNRGISIEIRRKSDRARVRTMAKTLNISTLSTLNLWYNAFHDIIGLVIGLIMIREILHVLTFTVVEVPLDNVLIKSLEPIAGKYTKNNNKNRYITCQFSMHIISTWQREFWFDFNIPQKPIAIHATITMLKMIINVVSVLFRSNLGPLNSGSYT